MKFAAILILLALPAFGENESLCDGLEGHRTCTISEADLDRLIEKGSIAALAADRLSERVAVLEMQLDAEKKRPVVCASLTVTEPSKEVVAKKGDAK